MKRIMNGNSFIFIALLFVSMNVYCEELSGELSEEILLDVDKAVELGIENNLTVAMERVSLETKKRLKDTSWNYFIPQVSLSASLYRTNEPPAGISIPGFYENIPEHYWKLSFGLSASLTLSASMIYGIKQTVIDYHAGVISLDMAERKITRDVKKIFYNIILMKENIKLMEQSISAMKDRYEQAESNYNNGFVSEYVMLSTRVAYENAKPGLQDLVIASDTLLMSFKQLIGVEYDTNITITGSIEPETATIVEKSELMELIEGRSDIRLQKKTLEVLKNVKDLKQSMLSPTFTIMYSMDPTFQKDPFSDPWYMDDWVQYSGRIMFMVNIPVDGLIPYSKSRVDIAGSNDAIKKAELGIIQIREAAALEIESTYMKLEKSRKALDALQLNVGLAERAYHLAEEAFNAGSKELLEVQNSELELHKAKIEVLKEKYNYIMGLLDLEYALNISLMEESNEE
ncbi:MAG: TolC family protein [Spirochaetales bacterium]|nr:TolC family protein [Spirochaetales bacterium]